MSEAALKYVQEQKETSLNELIDFLKIPSISTLPENKDDILAAAQWLMDHLKAIGLENVQLIETAGHPSVYADWLHAEGQSTVLVYGHYDVQPVDPIELWDSSPFEPTLKGEDLVARGSSDDKGQIFAHVKAAEALLKADGKLPVNIKFLIEGEEEIGSQNLTPALEANKELLQSDVCVISDSNILAPDRPSIVYGLRGIIYTEIEVTGPSLDLHSGRYGGGVHNPLQAMCEIITKLHDEDGRITIPGFYDKIRTLSDAEKVEMAALNSDETFLAETGAPATWGEVGYSTLERVGARATLEIHGIRGGFVGEGGKTVIPSTVLAKVSMRLAPYQPAEEIAQAYKEYVESIAPATVNVKVNILQIADPVLTERDHPSIKAAEIAYEKSFGKPPVFMLDGGSIPVVEAFQRLFGLPVVLMGFGLPDDRLHSPNEKFHLPNFYNGISCSIQFLQQLAKN